MKTNAFTLIELMLTVGILIILFAIVIPSFSRARENAREAKTQGELSSIYKAFTMYYGYTGKTPKNITDFKDYITITDMETKYELNPNMP